MMEIMVRTKRTTRYMNGIHGAEGNESKRYLPIYLYMEKMNFGFVPMVSVISAPQRVTDGLAIFLDIRAQANTITEYLKQDGFMQSMMGDTFMFQGKRRKRTDGM